MSSLRAVHCADVYTTGSGSRERMSEGTAGDLNPGPVVHLQGQGSVEGRVQDGVARFLGIPYAVAERWKAPKSPAPWQGTLFQRRWLSGAACFQHCVSGFALSCLKVCMKT